MNNTLIFKKNYTNEKLYLIIYNNPMLNFFCPISYSKEFKKIFSIKKFPIFMGASKKSHNYEYEILTGG